MGSQLHRSLLQAARMTGGEAEKLRTILSEKVTETAEAKRLTMEADMRKDEAERMLASLRVSLREAETNLTELRSQVMTAPAALGLQFHLALMASCSRTCAVQTASKLAGAESAEATAASRYSECAADLASLRSQLAQQESAQATAEAQLQAAKAEVAQGTARTAALSVQLEAAVRDTSLDKQTAVQTAVKDAQQISQLETEKTGLQVWLLIWVMPYAVCNVRLWVFLGHRVLARSSSCCCSCAVVSLHSLPIAHSRNPPRSTSGSG